MPTPSTRDAVIVGGGHNGLVAAALLERAGRSVLVLERRDDVGGAAVSGSPFRGVDARLSRYSYLVSLFPPALARLSSGCPIAASPARAWPPIRRYRRQRRVGVDAGRESPSRPCSRRLTRAAALPRRDAPVDRRRPSGGSCSSSRCPIWLERTLRLGCLARGIVLTDATIGTFAPADDPQLRQNRCFLYHVIGGSLGRPGRRHGRAVRRAGRRRPRRRGRDRHATPRCRRRHRHRRAERGGRRVPTGGAAAPGTCWPTSRRRCCRRCSAIPPAAEPAPEGSQLKLNMLLSRLPRLPDASVRHRGRVHRHVPRQRGLRAARARPIARRARGEIPSAAAVRAVLPLADRPERSCRPSCAPAASTR